MKKNNKKYENYLSKAIAGDVNCQVLVAIAYMNGEGLDLNLYEAFKWFKIAAKQGESYAQAETGIFYLEGEITKKNKNLAHQWFKKSAEQGYSFGEYLLGYSYIEGIGVKKNLDEAIKWFELAASQGSSDAQYELAQILLDSYYNSDLKKVNEGEKALKYLKLSANQGHENAIFLLGNRYANRFSDWYNKRLAIKWLKLSLKLGNFEAQYEIAKLYRFTNPKLFFSCNKRAAENGDLKAPLEVGLCFFYGKGVKKNLNEAVKYFKQFSSLDEWFGKEAEYYLGLCYKNGLGIKKDLKLAIKHYENVIKYSSSFEGAYSQLTHIYLDEGKYYDPKLAFKMLRKGCDKGFKDCFTNLGYCYSSGTGTKVNIPQAIKWYQLSSKTNNCSNAMFNLGHIFKEGRYKNINLSLKWFKLASKNGYSYASFHIAVHFQIESNNKEAIKWFKIGANQGDKYCQTYLGECYFLGNNIKKNIPLAIKWFKEADLQNWSQAQNSLGKLYELSNNKFRNYKTAIKYYLKAAKDNHLESFIRLAYIAYEGIYTKKNYKDTFGLINHLYNETKGSDCGEITALLSLCYYEGIGVKKDFKKYKKYLTRSISEGFKPNDYDLSNPYKNNFKFLCKRLIEDQFSWPVQNYFKGKGNKIILLGESVSYNREI